MNILFIGKFFPIQGGEATKAYWLMKKMVEYGHNVIIVTDTTNYKHFQLCHTDNVDNIKIFEYYDLKNSNFNKLEALIENVLNNKQVDIVFGWYLFHFAEHAIKAAKKYNKPVIIQHAGSDIKKLNKLDKSSYNYYINLFSEADVFLNYTNTFSLLNQMGFKNLYEHIPCMPHDFFNYNIQNNKKILVLGSKNQSKGFNKIQELSMYYQLKVDWYGSGETFINNDFFNTYDNLPIWDIPNLISQYDILLYAEENFDVVTHESRIPLEAISCGKLVLMSSNLKNVYQEYHQFIYFFDLNEKESFINSYKLLKHDYIEKSNLLKNFIQNKNYSDEIWYENIEELCCNLINKKHSFF